MAAIGVYLVEMDEAHQMQSRRGVAGREGARNDLKGPRRPDGVKQGGSLGLPGSGAAGKWNNGRKRRNSFEHD